MRVKNRIQRTSEVERELYLSSQGGLALWLAGLRPAKTKTGSLPKATLRHMYVQLLSAINKRPIFIRGLSDSSEVPMVDPCQKRDGSNFLRSRLVTLRCKWKAGYLPHRRTGNPQTRHEVMAPLSALFHNWAPELCSGRLS